MFNTHHFQSPAVFPEGGLSAAFQPPPPSSSGISAACTCFMDALSEMINMLKLLPDGSLLGGDS